MDTLQEFVSNPGIKILKHSFLEAACYERIAINHPRTDGRIVDVQCIGSVFTVEAPAITPEECKQAKALYFQR